LPARRTHSLPSSGQCSDDYSGIVVDDDDDDNDDDDNDGWNPTASVVVAAAGEFEFEFDSGVALFGSSRPRAVGNKSINQSITHTRLDSTRPDPTPSL